jgi:hypothetical protein
MAVAPGSVDEKANLISIATAPHGESGSIADGDAPG